MAFLWGSNEWQMLWEYWLSPTHIRYVWPYCRRPYFWPLMGAFFIYRPDDFDRSFPERLGRNARSISDRQIETLLTSRNWRVRVCAAWYAGLGRRSSFGPRIGELMLNRNLRMDHANCCIALGLMGGEVARKYLRTSLQNEISSKKRPRCPMWQIGALAHVEGEPPKEFLDPELWIGSPDKWDPEVPITEADIQYLKNAPWQAIEDFRKLVAYLEQHHMLVPSEILMSK
jgi:Family of unknown function (DUF6000)